jgi:hypothetical protein
VPNPSSIAMEDDWAEPDRNECDNLVFLTDNELKYIQSYFQDPYRRSIAVQGAALLKEYMKQNEG